MSARIWFVIVTIVAAAMLYVLASSWEPAPSPAPEPPPRPVAIDAPDVVRPIPLDPDSAYEATLAMHIEPPTAEDPQDAGKELQESIRRLTESVELAVKSQRELAARSPDRADEAAARAIELYEHAATEIEAAPPPPLPFGGDAERYRTAMGQLAESKRQRAAAIREGGL